MPIGTPRTPSYRLHRPSGQAVVTIDGRDHYLGKHGTPESRGEYDRRIAEWMLCGRRSPVLSADLTINELLVSYLRYADAYYTQDGAPTKEPEDIRLAIRPLRQLYGHSTASAFGPLALKVVRQAMIDADLCRTEVNKRVGKIKRIFKWATSEDLVAPSVFHALQTVPGLRHGRADVRESRPVKPVPDASIAAIRPYVSRQIWGMISLQLLTGARSGEIIAMRTIDIDTTGKTWSYTPQRHKTQHHGKQRCIYIGPRAQAVLREWLRPDLTAPMFQPREAMAELRARQRENRKTPVQPSQRDRSKRRPKKLPGLTYTVKSYCHAVGCACEKAGIDKWHPHQLRHNAATILRREFGLDVAKAVLGHSTLATTLLYAEADQEKARTAMEKVG
jgi:integrase